MSSLLVFNRVYRPQISQSNWYFRLLLWKRPSNLLKFSLIHLPPPPLPCVNKYRGIHTVCNGGGWGPRQINTCRQVPLLVNFSEKPTFRVWCLYRYFVHDTVHIGKPLLSTQTARFSKNRVRTPMCVSIALYLANYCRGKSSLKTEHKTIQLSLCPSNPCRYEACSFTDGLMWRRKPRDLNLKG